MFMSLWGSKEAFLVIFVIGKKVCEHSAISIDRNSHGRLFIKPITSKSSNRYRSKQLHVLNEEQKQNNVSNVFKVNIKESQVMPIDGFYFNRVSVLL